MDMIVVARQRRAGLGAPDPRSPVLDVTSRGEEPWVRFSPFYPHGGIPVPLSPGLTAASVEGIWQGLKVFAGADIDRGCFANDTMRGLKRTVRKHGAVLGHRAGVGGATLLDYRAARYAIYLPAYRWALDHCLQAELAALRELEAAAKPVVLLDYETNHDPDDLRRPLSHAWLIVSYLLGEWPAMPPDVAAALATAGAVV